MVRPPKIDISAFLAEDVGNGDVTAAIIPAQVQAEATVISRETAVVCGQAWFDAVFTALDPGVKILWEVAEGQSVEAGTPLCTLNGQARAILTGERTALNLLQTLSATATISRKYAQAVAGMRSKVLDTRKTIPGLREAQKYAVACGGCHNHRMGLYDGVLIKENHILSAGSIAAAVHLARQQSTLPVEVEAESLDEFDQACAGQPDRIMLDNFSLQDMRTAVLRNAGRFELEASGNVDLANIRDIAETGVDYISIGALTKNIQAIDLSMRVTLVR